MLEMQTHNKIAKIFVLRTEVEIHLQHVFTMIF